MRFKDERKMWYADTEILAARLTNKSSSEVQEILDDHDVITLRSGNRPKATLINRLGFIVFTPCLMLVVVLKWLCTGDRYLDSWEKRSNLLKRVLRFSGHGE